MVMKTSAGTDSPPENTHREIGVPTFIETASGSFKPVEECSKAEIAAEIMALLAQAESTLRQTGHHAGAADAETQIRSLLHEAKTLSDYLNI